MEFNFADRGGRMSVDLSFTKEAIPVPGNLKNFNYLIKNFCSSIF